MPWQRASEHNPCCESWRCSPHARGSTSRGRSQSRHIVKQPMEDLLGLTPREAEVLTLVARGHTNREIAEALVISIKTTGHHVSHILHKLDVPTRADAAAIAHRIGAAR